MISVLGLGLEIWNVSQFSMHFSFWDVQIPNPGQQQPVKKGQTENCHSARQSHNKLMKLVDVEKSSVDFFWNTLLHRIVEFNPQSFWQGYPSAALNTSTPSPDPTESYAKMR